MKKNVGKLDQLIRYVLAIVAVLVGLFAVGGSTTVWAIVLYVIAAVLAITALVGFCGLYAVFGINTCDKTK